jgi:hypothetical protein
MQLIKSLALAITKGKMRMPLPGTMGAPVFGGADVTKFIEGYKILSSCTGTDQATEHVYRNLRLLLLGDDPANYQDHERISDGELGAIETGAEGHCPARRQPSLPVHEVVLRATMPGPARTWQHRAERLYPRL